MSSDEVLPQATPTDPHEQLRALAGSWQGTTRTWFEPDKLADESATEGTIRPVLNSTFMLHEYRGWLQGERLHGLTIYGYNQQRGHYESAWIDSCHMGTAIMFSRGDTPSSPISVLGQYEVGDGPPWCWRTTLEMVDADHLVITAYNITPEGLVAKAVETTYHRVPA